MTTGIDITVWLAAGYAVFLLAAAFGVDRMARGTAARTARWHDGGFVYHADHDAWQCPQDQWLWPQSFDPDNRVMRYRGSPSVCNHCPVKDSCTSSDDGREMRRMVDTWPASESARFHRGIACAVTVLAVLWPLAWAFTVDDWVAQVMLLVVAGLLGVLSLPLWSHLRHTPADPHGVLTKSLDENVEERTAAAAALARRRTTYRSDRRDSPDRA